MDDPTIATSRITAYHAPSIDGLKGHGYTFAAGSLRAAAWLVEQKPGLYSMLDVLGLRAGMHLVFLTLAYILGIGFWAKPLVNNATMSLSDLMKAIPKAVGAGRSAQGK